MSSSVSSGIAEKQRVSRANLWLRSLQEIRDELPQGELGDKTNAILRLVINECAVGTPVSIPESNTANITVKLEKGEEVPRFTLVPLFVADLALNSYFSDIKNPTYSEALRSVLIPPTKIGSKWRGILMFHELLHAKHHLEGTFRDKEEPHWAEEVAVFEDEHAIMRAVFPGYKDRVNGVLDEIASTPLKGKNTKAISSTMDYLNWKEVFPEPQSKMERGLAKTAMIVDIAYQEIDAAIEDKEKALAQKVRFTKKYYSSDTIQ